MLYIHNKKQKPNEHFTSKNKIFRLNSFHKEFTFTIVFLYCFKSHLYFVKGVIYIWKSILLVSGNATTYFSYLLKVQLLYLPVQNIIKENIIEKQI